MIIGVFPRNEIIQIKIIWRCVVETGYISEAKQIINVLRSLFHISKIVFNE